MEQKYLIKDGKTDYKIVIPLGWLREEMQAAEDLRYFLKRATGIYPPIVYDTGLTTRTGEQLTNVDEKGLLLNEESKYISIGKTVLFERANISAEEKELKKSGYKIKTEKNCILICGATPIGTTNGVYGFLRECLHYDFFFNDCFYVDNVKDVPLQNYDVVKLPEFDNSPLSYGFGEKNHQVVRRYGFTMCNEFKIPIGDTYYGHNLIWGYLRPEKYAKTHPEWYYTGDNPRQTCFTAHGDDASVETMVETCANILKDSLIEFPNKSSVSLAIEDFFRACDCEYCEKARVKYGSHAGAMVDFTNRVMRKTKAWFNTPSGKKYERDLKIYMYAYLAFEDAPVVFEEKTGEYVPTITCDKGVIPMICPIYANYQYSLKHKENERHYENIKKWQKVASEIDFYLYDTNYRHYLIPFNTFDSLQDNYRLGKECKSWTFYNLGQSNQLKYSTGWSILKVYLQSKLVWDVESDLAYYKAKFFKHYFANGEKYMRAWFDECLEHLRKMRDEKGYKEERDVYLDPMKKEYWSKETLQRWLGYADSALSAIEGLKAEDYYQYCCVRKHILCERVSPMYTLIMLYADELDNEELLSLKQQLVDDIETLGLTRTAEGGDGDMETLYNKLFNENK